MPDDAPKIPFLARARLLFIGGVVGLLVGGAGAGKVWLDGRNVAAAKDAEIAAVKKAADDAASTAAENRQSLEQRANLLEARVKLARALDELDRRNFGSAQELVASAAAPLGDAGATATAEKVMRTHLEVSDDVEQTREVLHGLAREVDGLIGG